MIGDSLPSPAIRTYIHAMFDAFIRRMTAPEPDPLTGDDARLALAALLVRVARTDGEYARSEIDRIDALLKIRYNLGPFEVTKLRADAEVLEKEAPDTVRFTRAIKEAVPYMDRAEVVESLWEIALADGDRDHEEDALMRLVASMLGVNDRDSAHARQRAQKKA
jgi:uncharacterized tellurite resistance protein B-like protein